VPDDHFAPVVIVPIKPLAEAKTRLRDMLDDEARRALVLAMLIDTLAAIRAGHAGAILVTSEDPAYAAALAGVAAVPLPDDTRGYNEAVGFVLASSAVRRAGAALIVPADVPRATGADIRHAIAALRETEVVVARAFDGGTALLGLHPPDAIATAFGPQSANAHLGAARAAGRQAMLLDLPSLVGDIDSIEDLRDAPETLGPATRAFLDAHADTLHPHG